MPPTHSGVLTFAVANPRRLASERYRLLVEQLGAELGMRHGWKAQVAELLEVTPGYISKVLGGSAQAVSPATITKAVRRLGIKKSFFETTKIAEPKYSDFMGGTRVVAPPELGRIALVRGGEEPLVTAWGRVHSLALDALTGRMPSSGGHLYGLATDAEAELALARAVLAMEPIRTAIQVLLAPSAEALSEHDRISFVFDVLRLAKAAQIGLPMVPSERPPDETA